MLSTMNGCRVRVGVVGVVGMVSVGGGVLYVVSSGGGCVWGGRDYLLR